MDFELTEQQQLLRHEADRFSRQEYSFEQRQKIIEQALDAQVWQKFVDRGWLGLQLSESLQGMQASACDVAIFAQSLATALIVQPLWSNSVLAATLLNGCPQNLAVTSIAAGLCSGERRLAVVLPDDASFGWQRCNIESLSDANQYVLRGQQGMVYGAHMATDFLVVAKCADSAEYRLILVPLDTSGISVSVYPLVDGSSAADLTFESVIVTDDNLLLQGQTLSLLVQQSVFLMQLCLCAQASGIMQQVLDDTVAYCKQRQQFGKAIASFQVLQHKMADMFVEVEQAKSLVLMFAMRLDANESVESLTSAMHIMKARLSKAAEFVGQQGVQLHGGMGLCEELQIAHYFKRLTAIGQSFGTGDMHLSAHIQQQQALCC